MKRHLIVLIGLFCLSSLIWFAGPLLGLTTQLLRCGIIVALVGVYPFAVFIHWWRANRRGFKLRRQLQVQQQALSGRQLELEVLKQRMNETIASLKSADSAVHYRGNAALYALPWYIMLGVTAAGKSTLLRNARQQFMSTKQNTQSDTITATKNCDWWFSNKAIILDTAGRYTTTTDAQQEWLMLLSLLKKHRAKLPLNGILLSVSLLDILTADAKGLAWQADRLGERIADLYAKLGFVLPIYLIITKSDCLRGFESFFNDLDAKNSEQVWGVNLLEGGNKLTLLKEGLNKCYITLCDLRFHKISIARDKTHKKEIFEFPEEFRAAHKNLIQFTKLILENGLVKTPINLCGVYFTSAKQQDCGVQRIIGGEKTVFAYRQFENFKKNNNATSYFIKQLFSEVIFENKYAAVRDQQHLLTMRWLKSACVVGGLVGIAAAATLYSTSLTSNTLLLHHGVVIAKQLDEHLHSSRVLVRDKLGAITAAYQFYNSLITYKKNTPLHLRLGLYRGNTQIESYQTILTDALDDYFLDPIRINLERDLEIYHRIWQNIDADKRIKFQKDYYHILQAYLMLGFPSTLDVEQATEILLPRWIDILKRNSVHGNFPLYDMVKFYLQELKARVTKDSIADVLVVQPNLVETARLDLDAPTNADKIYAQIRSRGLKKWHAITLNSLVADKHVNLLISDYQLPGIYSAKAWREFIYPEINKAVAAANEDDWVIDASLEELSHIEFTGKNKGEVDLKVEKRLLREMRELYFTEYAHAWLRFLTTIRVKQFSSLNEAAKQMKVLASAQGPLAKIITLFKENMFLLPENPQSSSKKYIKFSHYVKDSKIELLELQKFLKPSKNNFIKQYLSGLKAIQNELAYLAVSPEVGHNAEAYVAKMLSDKPQETILSRVFNRTTKLIKTAKSPATQKLLRPVLFSAIRQAWRAVVITATEHIEEHWQHDVLAVYRQQIAGYFPFDIKGPDADLGAVTQFFRANQGVLWSFVARHVQPVGISIGQQWLARQWLGVGASFSNEFLQTLRQARIIADGLFDTEKQHLDFKFELYPEPILGLRKILFKTGGKTLRYQNGSQEWHAFTWPSTSPQKYTTLQGFAPKRDQATLRFLGPWGLFHLIARAELQSQGNAQYRLLWRVPSNKKVIYEMQMQLKLANNVPIIEELLFKPFVLPAKIVKPSVPPKSSSLLAYNDKQ